MRVERLTGRIIYREGKIWSPRERPTWMDEDSEAAKTPSKRLTARLREFTV